MVQNREFVLLGPMDWRPRFIQSEFNDLEIPYTVPQSEQGYINIDQSLGNDSNTGIEIFPLTGIDTPPHDPMYQNLSGPFYTYNETTAAGNYTVMDSSVDNVRGNLKNLTTLMRYNNELAGTSTVMANTTVTLATDRDSRTQFMALASSIPSDGSINYKFPEGFLTVSSSEMVAAVAVINAYVQNTFNWEVTTYSQIDYANTVDDLLVIYNTLKPQN